MTTSVMTRNINNLNFPIKNRCLLWQYLYFKYTRNTYVQTEGKVFHASKEHFAVVKIGVKTF